MNNIRIDWIDLTEGIAIFLMVCGHTSIPLSISNWIWSFHMPLFFIISGILFNATKYPNFNLFIKKRGKTLIIPYIIFSLITLLTIHDQTLKEWLYKGWINGCALWFIPVLFFAEIFSYFIIRYINSNCLILLTAITIGTIGYMLYFFNIHFPYNIDVSFYASFFYLIGYISKNKIIHYPPKHSLAICLLIVNIILSQILPRTDMAWNNCGWYGLNAINAIGGTFAIILITKTYFDNIYATPIKLFFKWAGHNTIIILGLSQIISTYIKIGFSYFSVPEIMNPFLRHIFLWIILYILSIIIRKYFPRIIGQK